MKISAAGHARASCVTPLESLDQSLLSRASSRSVSWSCCCFAGCLAGKSRQVWAKTEKRNKTDEERALGAGEQKHGKGDAPTCKSSSILGALIFLTQRLANDQSVAVGGMWGGLAVEVAKIKCRTLQEKSSDQFALQLLTCTHVTRVQQHMMNALLRLPSCSESQVILLVSQTKARTEYMVVESLLIFCNV